MGREVRMVPADWVHPFQEADGQGGHLPKHSQSFAEAAKEWKQHFLAWETGHNATLDRPRAEDETEEYWEYGGTPPDRKYHMPDWPEDTRTHYQMYETCSEGTPISPVMETPEKLARWLTDHGVSAFGGETASYDAWLRVARGGYACSAVISGRGLESGVEALSRDEG